MNVNFTEIVMAARLIMPIIIIPEVLLNIRHPIPIIDI